jgi:regulator of protease activity HflC (stomatin/prohibitin superfamily)
MQRVLARQAEAERERRAKVINAEGEFQAAQRLAEAAQIIERHPAALQLRYLQTLATIARSNPSTTLFPIPIDLMRPFLEANDTRRITAGSPGESEAELPPGGSFATGREADNRRRASCLG